MKSPTAGVLSIAFLALLLCSPGAAQVLRSATSRDGTQSGSIVIDGGSTRGSVSSSSTGTNRASASSSLTIGPTGTQASFFSQGDDEAVSRSVVVDGTDTPRDDGISVSTASAVAGAPASFEEKESTVTGDTLPAKKEDPKKDSTIIVEPKSTKEGGRKKDKRTSEVVKERICVVDDEAEFKKQLQYGTEVTLVRALGDSVEVITERKSPYSSFRSSTVTQYIPKNIHDECGISYADLGLEDREGDQYSSVSSSTGFSYSSSSSSSSSSSKSSGSSASASAVRKSVLERLCSEEFFRQFALYNECADYAYITKRPW